MANRLIFVRHAEPRLDSSVSPAKWELTDTGWEAARALVHDIPSARVDAVYASEEKKAYQTVLPLAEKYGLKVHQLSGLDEQKRGGTFLPAEEFRNLKQKKLNDLDANPDGGETSRQAVNRFISEVKRIDGMHDSSMIVICSHGVVLSLYFAYLTGELADVYRRWSNLGYCAVGMVVSGEGVRDIV